MGSTATMPPVPPAIAAQQQQPSQGQPPLRQFAQDASNASPMAGAQAAVAQTPSMQLVEQLMGEITQKLEAVAKIVVNERPELVPLLKPVVSGLSMFMQQIKTSDSGAPDGGSQGTAGQGAPDAGGSAAMGVPPQ